MHQTNQYKDNYIIKNYFLISIITKIGLIGCENLLIKIVKI